MAEMKQDMYDAFFNKARVFLSRGGLSPNKGTLLEKEKTNYSAGQKTLS